MDNLIPGEYTRAERPLQRFKEPRVRQEPFRLLFSRDPIGPSH
jgi:hypothetical protein